MNRFSIVFPIAILATTIGVLAVDPAEDNKYYTKIYTAKNLYTEPDSSGGGIKGVINKPANEIEAIFALPQADPTKCYKGNITSAQNRSFIFQGLPSSKYDLVVIFKNKAYDGLELHTEKSTLTKDDLNKIEETINKAEPFFTKKRIHRVEGSTGKMEGEAKAIVTYLRDKPSKDYGGHFYNSNRRAFKLVMLNDIGPGFQIKRTREIYTLFVTPEFSIIPFQYNKSLNSIRVTDEIKDVGNLDL